MTIRQTEAYFKRRNASKAASMDRVIKGIKAQAKRFKKHPEEALAFAVEAGVLTPTGRWSKPYRRMMKEDREYAARMETQQ